MTALSAQEMYDDGYRAGLKRALTIVRQTEAAPNTRCSAADFGAARRRIERVLRGAIWRNAPADPVERGEQ